MHIADYEPHKELVYHLCQLHFEFGQPSADNLEDWEKIAVQFTLKFPIRVTVSELEDLLEENRYLIITPPQFQAITSVQNVPVLRAEHRVRLW